MEEMALVFQSLDDVTRLRILALLLQEEELCVCDIVAVLQLPQSTVSRHLSLLKSAGWLADRRTGLWINYSICQKLPPGHQSLLPVMHTFICTSATATADMTRFRSLSRNNCCA